MGMTLSMDPDSRDAVVGNIVEQGQAFRAVRHTHGRRKEDTPVSERKSRRFGAQRAFKRHHMICSGVICVTGSSLCVGCVNGQEFWRYHNFTCVLKMFSGVGRPAAAAAVVLYTR